MSEQHDISANSSPGGCTSTPAKNSPDSLQIIVGTAGHIDHGKSALVLALTGTDPDRLAEEKRRGITIELGFARLDLPGGIVAGVVDVPGHERFVRQMIAGSTGIDIALLCIAADDGIMPQTVEHLQVLELLEVPRCVIALTKSDLVDAEWLAFMTDELRNFLAVTPYRDADIIPVSSRTGTGLDELREALASVARTSTQVRRDHIVRLPVDRVFTIKGSGTVITGTLWSGSVAPGDELECLPSGMRVRVRGVQVHDQPVGRAHESMRTALNLSSVSTDEIRPGMLLATPGAITPTTRFDAQFSYLGTRGGVGSASASEASGAGEEHPFASGTAVRIAHGTTEVIGRLLLMDGQSELAPRQTTTAQIRLDEPLPLSRGDHFVVQSMTPIRVIGGGTVLHCHPRRRTNLKPAEHDLLEALRAGNDAAACDAALALQPGLSSAQQIAETAGLDLDVCTARLEERCADKNVTTTKNAPKAKPLIRIESEAGLAYYAPASVMQAEAAHVEQALLTFHADNPNAAGISKEALRQQSAAHCAADAFDALCSYLASKEQIVSEDGLISHPKEGAHAKKLEQEIAEALAARLEQAGSTPPSIDELIAELGLDAALVRRALASLEAAGRAQRVDNTYYFATQALEQLKSATVARLQEKGEASAAELRDAMGISRKYAIPLLEYFDSCGLTRRSGDLRTLGAAHAGQAGNARANEKPASF